MTGPLNRRVTTPANGVELTRLRDYFVPLLMRNIATDGYPFIDPAVLGGNESDPQQALSKPGCVIASPSFRDALPEISQNYVFNWVRDAAIVALELAAASLPALPSTLSDVLDDYVSFAALCQSAAPTELDRAKYTISGRLVEGWPRQNDGPALQGLALLALFDQLSESAKNTARDLLRADLAFVLAHYQQHNTNVWEEVDGQSLFTRSVQLRFLRAIGADDKGAGVPAADLATATTWLADRIADHVDNDRYVSILEPGNPRADYDPNADVIAACIYGAIPPTDPVLLNTAAALRHTFTEGNLYPINRADAQLGIGPLIGRYPGDVYDGFHVSADEPGATRGHPWVVCTANYAELYYRLAAVVLRDRQVPDDPRATAFLTQAGTSSAAPAADVATALRAAGDRMLQAIVYHSDHLELSEQFHADTGFESSVRNLSWSYASFLSALRARDQS
jgi:glucoamylase